MNFTSIIYGTWLLFVVYWLISAAGAKKNATRPWKGIVFRMVVFAGLFAYLQTVRPNARLSHAVIVPVPVGVLGVAICLLGIALAVWARIHIGRNWGMPMSIKQEPELVDTGPYSYIRHPIYTGFLIALLGSAIAAGWWWGIALLTFAVYFLYSAKMEEKRLSQVMPTQYPAYMRRTKMLIPFVL
ncbi:MAG TPA: isoprenylcysteine carboxylmethyltransferase family protein [Gemmatimonadaceae bacterium]|jgi:protein-S-isoprenylcysteine O-methyltransferase Ste14